MAQQFDVFLAHSSKDKPLIRQIYRELKQRGIRPWLDEEEIAPGTQFQDEIQRAIGTVRAAAIFIGEDLGKWQELELRALIQRCISKSVRIIPVLLPGIESIPEDEYFLSQYQFVKFGETLQNEKAFDLLEWGITDVRPQNLDSVSVPDAQNFSHKPIVSSIREIDPSKILYIKNIKDPSGVWAYRLEGVRSGQQPIFELMWQRNGRGVSLPKAGDLMILHQQAKVTHVVEFMDDAIREEGFSAFRRVKVVWMPERQDWHHLPHQKEVLGFSPRYSDGNTHALESPNFKTFQKAWKRLSDFQLHLVNQLKKDEELLASNTEKEVTLNSSRVEGENTCLSGFQQSNLFPKENSKVNGDIPELWLALTFGFCGILGYLVTLSSITPSAVSWAVVMVWSVVVAWDQIELGALFMAGALTAIWDRLFDYDSGAGIIFIGAVAFFWAGVLAVVAAIACAVAIFVAGSKLRRTFPYEQVFLILMGSATVGLVVGTSLKLLLLSLSQSPALPQ